MSSKKLIEVNNISIIRNKQLIQENLSFTWKKGEQWCLTGATGSGKTSFLKTIIGSFYPQKGSINYPFADELNIRREDIQKHIAFVPQEVKIKTHFIQDLYYQRRYYATEQNNIPLCFQILLEHANNQVKLVREIAELMNLKKLYYQAFIQLSNGQTRRLMIALGLLKQPKILLLDNPYIGLDAESKANLNQYLEKLVKNGLHILISTEEDEDISKIKFINRQIKLNKGERGNKNNQFPSFLKRENKGENKLISMSHLHVKYEEKTILNLPHWEVSKLDKWVILGKNGSGKSTLLSLITADHPQAYSNKIFIFGQARGIGTNIWDIKRRIGYFSPELLRFFKQNISIEELIYSAWSESFVNYKKINAEEKNKIYLLVKWLEIDYLLDRKMRELSFGEQKLVLIARAMIKNPELLILDEPLQGLDKKWKRKMKEKINIFATDRSVLYVTHDINEIPEGKWKYLYL